MGSTCRDASPGPATRGGETTGGGLSLMCRRSPAVRDRTGVRSSWGTTLVPPTDVFWSGADRPPTPPLLRPPRSETHRFGLHSGHTRTGPGVSQAVGGEHGQRHPDDHEP